MPSRQADSPRPSRVSTFGRNPGSWSTASRNPRIHEQSLSRSGHFRTGLHNHRCRPQIAVATTHLRKGKGARTRMTSTNAVSRLSRTGDCRGVRTVRSDGNQDARGSLQRRTSTALTLWAVVFIDARRNVATNRIIIRDDGDSPISSW